METTAQSPTQLPAEFEFLAQVSRLYADLMKNPARESGDGEITLGGRLLYAGELDQHGRALVVAANIAGAASLAATGDPAAQKLAIRDGIVDFLVNSLDEALRILKNEIRKHETVAVCVALTPDAVEREMHERGVVADLKRPALPASSPSSPSADPAPDKTLTAWSVHSSPAIWLPKLDAVAIECLPASAAAQRRWLRLAPRYLGRLARSARLLQSDHEFAARFLAQVRDRFQLAQIGAVVDIYISDRSLCNKHRFAPRAD
jgi:hypothetical protein